MKIIYHPNFQKNLNKFPVSIQNKFAKQIAYLLYDIRHPSLHAKKYDESQDIWQARVDKNFRFYFSVDGNTYILLDVKHHPK